MTEFPVRVDRGGIYQDFLRDSAAKNRAGQYDDDSGSSLKTASEITS